MEVYVLCGFCFEFSDFMLAAGWVRLGGWVVCFWLCFGYVTLGLS